MSCQPSVHYWVWKPAALAAILALLPCVADASQITLVDLHVNGPRPGVVAGTELTINSAVSVPPGLRVRFICGTRDYNLSTPHRISADGRCWIYESSVWEPITTSEHELKFKAIPLEYVAVDSAGHTGDQVYTLVFEDGELPSGSIQILIGQAPAYFRHVQEILVRCPAGVNGKEILRNKQRAYPNRGPGTECVEEITRFGDTAIRFASAKDCGSVRLPSWPGFLKLLSFGH
jgi:hypothetical protein